MKNEITLLKKDYHGFEDFYDYFRDVSETCDFPEDETFKSVKGDFSGTIKVSVVFIPSEGDIETKPDMKDDEAW